MQILSALDAISPAIARTRLVLFTPFRLGRTWKLSAAAYFSFGGTLFFPFPLVYLALLPGFHTERKGIVAVLLVCILLGTALYAFVFYLCSRMHFVFFDIVLNRGEFIAPAWRKYARPSLIWTAVKAGIGTLMIVIMAAPLVAYFHHLTAIMQQMTALKPGQPPPPELIATIFAGYGIVLLVGGTFFIAVATLDSFIVPSMALENAPLGEAFSRFITLARREPGQLLAYIALKIGLGIASYFAVTIVFEVVLVLVAVVVALIVGLIGFLLHLVGVPMPILTGLGVLVAVLFGFASFGYGVPLAIGPVFTFMQAYTLYFLGGRYPLLGQHLELSTPPPPAPLYPSTYAYAPPPPTQP